MPGSSDLTEFEAFARRDKRTECRIRILLDDLSDTKDREALEAAFGSDLPNRAILGWLGARKLKATNSALTSHRHRTCTCNGPPA